MKNRESGEREEGVFIVRKALTSLSPAEFFKIRDERIKKPVFERLAAFGIEPVQKGKKDGCVKLDFKPDQIKKTFAEPLGGIGANSLTGSISNGLRKATIRSIYA